MEDVGIFYYQLVYFTAIWYIFMFIFSRFGIKCQEKSGNPGLAPSKQGLDLHIPCVVGHFPGVGVIITIFCDFCRFFCEKIDVFLKTNVMIKFLHYFFSF
jgi:hypothetical protein